MTLNATGPISLGGSTAGQSVNLELSQSATAQISFNDTNVRTLTGTTAGTALVMPTNFYGKSNFSVSGGSTSVSGSSTRSGAGSKSVTTSSASAGTPVGGTSPYSYLWQYVSGDTFTPTTSTSSSTTFSVLITVALGESVTKSGVYRCRVTDSASNVAYGPNCTVEATLSEVS